MRRSAEINGIVLKIGPGLTQDERIHIGDRFLLSKKYAPDFIKFIQDWLDHDPEKELLEHVKGEFLHQISYDESAKRIIAAVREHDAQYGK